MTVHCVPIMVRTVSADIPVSVVSVVSNASAVCAVRAVSFLGKYVEK